MSLTSEIYGYDFLCFTYHLNETIKITMLPFCARGEEKKVSFQFSILWLTLKEV